ncbi:MAG: APC family permease [Solirubrobacterales bacterium]
MGLEQESTNTQERLVESTLPADERRKLHKVLGGLDTFLMLLTAVVLLDTVGTAASFGPQGFIWIVVVVSFFSIPFAFLMAEVGSTFTGEGGAYQWVRMAYGRAHATLFSTMYWINNPLWLGGSLVFTAAATWQVDIGPLSSGSPADYVFKLAFIWISVLIAVASLSYGKWVPNVGAVLRALLVAIFTVTVGIYAIDHGVHGFPASQFSPTMAVFLAAVPILIFNFSGFELSNTAAEEMVDPQRDVPKAILRTLVVGAILYCLPVLGIILVLPPELVTGLSGFLDALSATFVVYGSAAGTMLTISAALFIFALLTAGSVWIMGADRLLAVAASDGAFVPSLGRFNARLGTPVRVNILSGVIASAFMVVAQVMLESGSADAFSVVLTIAISVTLISYLWIFPAVLRLRHTEASVERPFRVPFGERGIWTATILATAFTALGAWETVFPGTLEPLFGISYSFQEEWGVGRGEFEALTLGTLAIIVAIALFGGWAGRRQMKEGAATATPFAAAAPSTEAAPD